MVRTNARGVYRSSRAKRSTRSEKPAPQRAQRTCPWRRCLSPPGGLQIPCCLTAGPLCSLQGPTVGLAGIPLRRRHEPRGMAPTRICCDRGLSRTLSEQGGPSGGAKPQPVRFRKCEVARSHGRTGAKRSCDSYTPWLLFISRPMGEQERTKKSDVAKVEKKNLVRTRRDGPAAPHH